MVTAWLSLNPLKVLEGPKAGVSQIFRVSFSSFLSIVISSELGSELRSPMEIAGCFGIQLFGFRKD